MLKRDIPKWNVFSYIKSYVLNETFPLRQQSFSGKLVNALNWFQIPNWFLRKWILTSKSPHLIKVWESRKKSRKSVYYHIYSKSEKSHYYFFIGKMNYTLQKLMPRLFHPQLISQSTLTTWAIIRELISSSCSHANLI